MKDSLVSIIIPVYNVESYLKKCVNSILCQDYTNLEIILIDDGSTDSSGKMCDELRLLDDRIKVFHKDNGGLSDARNMGLDYMTGDYVTFVDSDDWVAKDYISSLMRLIKKYNSQIAVGKYINVSEFHNKDTILDKNKRNIEKCFSKKQAMEALLYQKFFTTAACCKLYDVRLWRNLRFPKNKLYEDVLAIFQVIEKARRVAFSNHVIYYYLQRSNSIVRKRFSLQKMDYVYNTKSILKTVQEKYPSLEKAAVSRVLWAEIHVIVHMDDYRKYSDQFFSLWSDIKKNRRIVIWDAKSSMKNKLVAVMSYGGATFLKQIFNMSKIGL